MDGVEFKELFKVAVETLREKTITPLLEADVTYQEDSENEGIAEMHYLQLDLTEEQFYQGRGQTPTEKVQAETVPEASQSDKEMLLKLLANPKMAALLKSLAKNLYGKNPATWYNRSIGKRRLRSKVVTSKQIVHIT